MTHPADNSQNPESDCAHPSVTRLSFARRRPAIVALGAVALGVYAGQSSFLSYWWWLALAVVAFALAATFFRKNAALSAFFVLLLALSLSGFRAGLQTHGVGGSHISALADDSNKRTLYVTVDDWPDVREHRTLLTVDVDSVKAVGGAATYHGGLLISIATSTTEFQYGDKLIVSGEIRSPPRRLNPGGFDYARFLRWRNIYGIVYLPHPFGIQRNPQSAYSLTAVVDDIHAFILRVFQRTLDDEQAALASGFLIGETSGISENVYNQFRNSGTLHLLAVSGSNVAIVLLTLRLLLWPFPVPRRTLYLLMIFAAILFCFVSHNQPSVIRATVMVSLYLLGRLLQRPIDYHNIIASAGMLILLWSPRQLFDVGFQLSFVVAWAILLAMDVVNKIGASKKKKRWFKYFAVPLTVAFAAQVAATPITLYYFGSAPAWSTVANIVIGPLVSLAVAISILTLFLALILAPLADFLGALLNQGLELILWMLDIFGGPHAPQLRANGMSAALAFASLGFVFLSGTALLSIKSRRAFIWIAASAPTLLAGWAMVKHLTEDTSARFFATRGGVFSILDTRPPLVIISDLRGDPLDLFTYELRPLIEQFVRADSFHLVALSSDHATLTSAIMTLDSFPGAELNVTAHAEGFLRDQLSCDSSARLGSRIKFARRHTQNAIGSPRPTGREGPTLTIGLEHAGLNWRRQSFLFFPEGLNVNEWSVALGEARLDSENREEQIWIIAPDDKVLATIEKPSVQNQVNGREISHYTYHYIFQRRELRNSGTLSEQQFKESAIYLSESGALQIAMPEPDR